MITCPHCQAENSDGALVCHSCAQALAEPAPADTPELPQWLRQLKPAEDTPAAEADSPVPADAAPPTVTPVPTGGQEEAWQELAQPLAAVGAPGPNGALPNGAAPALAPEDKLAAMRPPSKPAAPASRPASAPSNEAAALISEDDLPAWLRAFSEPQEKTDTRADDQSWMLGGEAASGAGATANLEQTWQAAAPPPAADSEAAAAFAKLAETTPGATHAERRIVMPAITAPPAPIEEPALAEPVVRSLPQRPVATRAKQRGARVQRAALLTFLAALVIFLIVLGIFVIFPAVR
ncbi:MAG TPA: zinc ribbon domain-containing protein [Thermomicrobiales bacterium]|nr:zinc ribbon domain-containing protein [Thermomicrobiales bacterium]